MPVPARSRLSAPPRNCLVSHSNPAAASQAQFHTTRWSVVLGAAGQRDSATVQEALTELCQTYWQPLYAYLRRTGYGPADAEDLVQGFLVALLERRDLEHVTPDKGRFRSFLLASLKHYASNVRDWETARKRGGGLRRLSLETAEAEQRLSHNVIDRQLPEALFDRQWALTLLDRVRARLQQDYEAAGQGVLFSHLQVYLTGELAAPPYADVARNLDQTEAAVKMAVSRLRQRFRDRLRSEIAHTVATDSEIDDEIQHLIAALQGA
uniref:Sigma-70 family RNA polymerase sigma factor n=1 Tax=Schlesneria paludicola TaxID=360056 RepID=A0A7C2NYL9_9PLAN